MFRKMRATFALAITWLASAATARSITAADFDAALIAARDAQTSASCTPPATTPIPPSLDPWYKAPSDLTSQPPGHVFKIRPAPGNATSYVTNCSAIYNILYRTTNSQYQPDWAVTTVFVPQKPAAALLSYQVPYDTADVDDSPSFALYAGVPPDVSVALAKGYFVNVPDYEGPLASFTAGVLSGHSTLDSIRAVLSPASAVLGLLPNTRYAMWGYSGGALASEWAAELQVQYAPELKFAGAALGGLTPNVTSTLLAVNKSPDAGLIPSAILGITSQYPVIQKALLARLKPTGTPYNASGFLAAYNYSLVQASEAYLFQDITAYFTGGLADLTTGIVLPALRNDGVMGYHGTPQMPLYVYKAINDEVAPINDTDALVARYCGIGVDIEYVKNPIGGHSAEFTNGDPGATKWLDGVLAPGNGTAVGSGCSVQVIATNITDSPLRKRAVEGRSARKGSWLDYWID